MTLTFELVTCQGRTFSSKVIIHTHRHTRLITLPGPLKWL